MQREEIPLVVLWERILGELLDTTQKFPKSVRFTFSSRIDNLALDILEGLVTARYSRKAQRDRELAAVDMRLARLRVLLRLCYERRYLDIRCLEHLAGRLDEAGRMLGGWLKEAARP